jgi:hypothetical protein
VRAFHSTSTLALERNNSMKPAPWNRFQSMGERSEILECKSACANDRTARVRARPACPLRSDDTHTGLLTSIRAAKLVLTVAKLRRTLLVSSTEDRHCPSECVFERSSSGKLKGSDAPIEFSLSNRFDRLETPPFTSFPASSVPLACRRRRIILSSA